MKPSAAGSARVFVSQMLFMPLPALPPASPPAPPLAPLPPVAPAPLEPPMPPPLPPLAPAPLAPALPPVPATPPVAEPGSASPDEQADENPKAPRTAQTDSAAVLMRFMFSPIVFREGRNSIDLK